jgi:hypothetical protein
MRNRLSAKAMVLRICGACAAVVLLLLGSILGGLAPGARAGMVEDRDGVPAVVNTQRPGEGRQIWKLRELWRVSSEDDDELLIGRIQDAIAGSDGTLYLLDQQLAQIHVFSPAGQYLRSLSREGDGPGETRNPMAVILPPGGGLGLVQAFPARIVTIDFEGNPLSPINLRSAGASMGTDRLALSVRSRGGTLAYSGRTFSIQREGPRPKNLLMICEPDGEERISVIEKESGSPAETRKWVEKDEYFVHRGRWNLGPDGRIYAAPKRDTYAIHVYGEDGRLERIIERDYHARRRTEEDKAGMGISMATPDGELEIDNVIADLDPCVSGIRVSETGDIWVEHSRSNRGLPLGVFQVQDIFDGDGHYRHEIIVMCEEERAEDDQLFYVADDRVILVKGFDARISISIGGGGAGVDVPEEERPPLEVVYYAIDRS